MYFRRRVQGRPDGSKLITIPRVISENMPELSGFCDVVLDERARVLIIKPRKSGLSEEPSPITPSDKSRLHQGDGSV